MLSIDEKDVKLLRLLQGDGRLSYRQLAKKGKMAVLTVMKRVKRLEAEKVITGYQARVDPTKIGYDVHAFITVRIAKGKLFEVERKIASEKCVSAVYDHTGHFDTSILAHFKSTSELDRFVKKLQKYDFIERTETRLVLNTIKEEELKV